MRLPTHRGSRPAVCSASCLPNEAGAMPGILRRRLIMLSIIAVLLTAAMIASKLAA